MASELRRTENEFILQTRNELVANKVKDIAPGDIGESIELKFLCECSDLNCGEHITLRIDEYQSVTRLVGQFIVFPLHERKDIEAVVATDPRFNVVQKRNDLVQQAL